MRSYCFGLHTSPKAIVTVVEENTQVREGSVAKFARRGLSRAPFRLALNSVTNPPLVALTGKTGTAVDQNSVAPA